MNARRPARLVLPPIALAVAALAGCTAADASGGAEPAARPAGSPPAEEPTWSYSGSTGPAHWGELAPACGERAESAQSPLDLDPKTFADARPAQTPRTDYSTTEAVVVDTGHTVEAVPDDDATGSVTLDGTSYSLRQLHLHAPSEHTVDGRHAAMELHLVHKDAEGEIAVVAILLDRGPSNAPLTPLFDTLRQDPGRADHARTDVWPIDVGALVPADTSAARYTGSLTTPPCTEGVRWVVMDDRLTVSPEQLEAFRALYADSHRPTQPLHGREVVATD